MYNANFVKSQICLHIRDYIIFTHYEKQLMNHICSYMPTFSKLYSTARLLTCIPSPRKTLMMKQQNQKDHKIAIGIHWFNRKPMWLTV